MWPWWSLVHPCLFNRPYWDSMVDQSFKIIVFLYYSFCKVLDIKASFRVFTNHQILFFAYKVLNWFVIDLKVSQLDFKEFWLFDTIPQSLETSLYDSIISFIARHRVSLAWTRLTVCENTSIISFEHVWDDSGTNLFKYCLLTGIRINHAVKRVKVFVCHFDRVWVPTAKGWDTWSGAWLNSDCDFDVLVHWKFEACVWMLLMSEERPKIN